MRRIREVLRLRHQCLTERVIARMLGVSNGVVHGYARRARLAGLSWPLPEGLDDEGLELLLFPAPTAASQSDPRPAPDWDDPAEDSQSHKLVVAQFITLHHKAPKKKAPDDPRVR